MSDGERRPYRLTGTVGLNREGRLIMTPMVLEGEFSGTLYPGAAERLDEMTRSHPDYCNACEGFPCTGGHPGPAEG
jgi:hypothetical protein